MKAPMSMSSAVAPGDLLFGQDEAEVVEQGLGLGRRRLHVAASAGDPSRIRQSGVVRSGNVGDAPRSNAPNCWHPGVSRIPPTKGRC